MSKNTTTHEFHAPQENYTQLRGDVQPVHGRINVWDTDFVLSKYVSETDTLIGIMDGSISHDHAIDDPDNPEKSHEKPDVVIWLDKSARPVSWLVDAYWEQFAKPGEKKPEFDFLNIDRTDWFVKQGCRKDVSEARLGPEDFDIDAVSDEDIARIRAIFTIGEIDEQDWQESVWKLPTRLDDKNILVVDEVKNRGGTLAIAQKLLKRAFPGATVSGDYFWKVNGRALNGDANENQMGSPPVWYSRENTYGRGIGDISRHYYENLPDSPDNFKKKLGWIALSAPHYNRETFELLPDKQATQLLQDIAFSTYDVAAGNILRVPDANRDIEEAEAIIEAQGLDLKQFKQLRETRAKKNPS